MVFPINMYSEFMMTQRSGHNGMESNNTTRIIFRTFPYN